MKVLSGAHRPDGGSVEMNGQPLALSGPLAARKAGIAMIYQELTLAPHLTVEENVTLGLEEGRCGFLKSQAAKVSAALALLAKEACGQRQSRERHQKEVRMGPEDVGESDGAEDEERHEERRDDGEPPPQSEAERREATEKGRLLATTAPKRGESRTKGARYSG